MAPFPEAEDMTIKRLYVALKRSDMQLLQMGAHKLHEKFHTGHKFELTEDLKQILSYVEEQEIPNDIKDLLIKTITDILNGTMPENNYSYEAEIPFEEETKEETYQETYNQVEEKEDNFVQDENINIQNETIEEPVIFTPKEFEAPNYNEPYNQVEEKEDNFVQETYVEQYQEPVQEAYQEPVQEYKEEYQEQTYQEEYEEPVVEQYQEPVQEVIEENKEEYKEPVVEEYQEQTYQEPTQEYKEEYQEPYNQVKILEEKKSTLKNVAIFYDDKASFVDFGKNKQYRNELDLISLNKESHPMNTASEMKSIVDVQVDEFGEIVKMLNTIKGDVYFITTSKSENVLKTFIGYDVDFEILNTAKGETPNKTTKIVPLFGLSNLFFCPKCGEKEYFAGFHNKVLSLQCKNCNGVMYPEIYESQNFETTANPYNFIKALSLMSKADTWILINPPLENNKALIFEYIKSAYEASKPKKVYILSKETTKKEYYKQIFKEINGNCIVNSDYITQDSLCEDFINNEMSTLKVNV